jgi:hypothetical protein
MGGGRKFDMSPLDTCSGVPSTVAGYVKPFSAVAFIILALLAVVRLLMGSFGFDSPGSSPAPAAAVTT